MQLKDHSFHHHIEQDFKDIATKLGLRVERFGIKHQALFFLVVFYATILFTRSLVLLYNPNPFLLGVELHHIHYGLTLLVLTVLYMLFVQWNTLKHFIFVILSAISIGLIMDEIVYISAYMQVHQYGQTLFSALVIGAMLALVLLIIKEELAIARGMRKRKK